MSFARSLLDQLPSCIAVVTENGAIRYRNAAFDEIFGSDAEHWLKEASRAVAGERGWLQGFFLEADEHRTIDVEIEGRIYRIDRIMQLDPEDGHEEDGTRLALSFEDVTTQREAEQAKSDFTAQIVHDLRGPLSGIQGTLEFVLSQEGTKLDSIYSDLLQEAQRESERMMGLINEILDFSKIQSGNFSVENEPIRVAGVLKRAVRSLQTVAARDEVFLLSAHGRDVPQIIGSVEKLTQAVINLISNSLKFTPKKGLISVGAQIVRNGDASGRDRRDGDRQRHGHPRRGAGEDLREVQAERNEVAPRRRRDRPRALHREADRGGPRRRSQRGLDRRRGNQHGAAPAGETSRLNEIADRRSRFAGIPFGLFLRSAICDLQTTHSMNSSASIGGPDSPSGLSVVFRSARLAALTC